MFSLFHLSHTSFKSLSVDFLSIIQLLKTQKRFKCHNITLPEHQTHPRGIQCYLLCQMSINSGCHG